MSGYMSGYGNKRKGNNWNKFQSSMPKMPSMPALGSQMISGGMGAKGQVSLGSGYSKAKRFGSQPDLTAFLKKYNIDYDGCKTNMSKPSDLLKF